MVNIYIYWKRERPESRNFWYSCKCHRRRSHGVNLEVAILRFHRHRQWRVGMDQGLPLPWVVRVEWTKSSEICFHYIEVGEKIRCGATICMLATIMEEPILYWFFLTLMLKLINIKTSKSIIKLLIHTHQRQESIPHSIFKINLQMKSIIVN